MHSPLEIARNYVEIGIHKVRLSALKMLVLGMFAGMFIGFAGIASTIGGTTVENASLSRLVSACIFPSGMAMVLIAGSELFTGNNLIIIALLEKKQAAELRAMNEALSEKAQEMNQSCSDYGEFADEPRR